MAEWTEFNEPIEKGAPAAPVVSVSTAPPRFRPSTRSAPAKRVGLIDRGISFLSATTFANLFAIWLWMVLGCAAVYWIVNLIWPASLIERGDPMQGLWESLGSTVYFSFVTATSVGFGDIIPIGFIRAIAIAEAAAGLVLFGCVISKLVSRRQEVLLEETHRIAFENRLARVRTGLHLLLSEFQMIGSGRINSHISPERVASRFESALTMFVAELRVVHQLLYRIEDGPDEATIEALLLELGATLSEIVGVLEDAKLGRSERIENDLKHVRRLAGEICSDCVPIEYAEHLRTRMNDVQRLAQRL